LGWALFKGFVTEWCSSPTGRRGLTKWSGEQSFKS